MNITINKNSLGQFVIVGRNKQGKRIGKIFPTDFTKGKAISEMRLILGY